MLVIIFGGRFEDLGVEEIEVGLFLDICLLNGFLCMLLYVFNVVMIFGGRFCCEGLFLFDCYLLFCRVGVIV